MSAPNVVLSPRGRWSSTPCSAQARSWWTAAEPDAEVLQRVELSENQAPFALVLGGPDRRTLFILAVEWRPADGHFANLDGLANGPRTGQILTARSRYPASAAMSRAAE
jgi:sugar lactone lactonase YvrE